MAELNISNGLIELDKLELFKDYPAVLLDVAAAFCIIFMVIGIPGNLITIICLARYKKVRNATAIFIINLSCSDFLFCCFNLPLATMTFVTRSWPLGEFMCKFFPFTRFLFAAISIFTVLAITVNRYILISHPRLYMRLFTKRNMALIIAAIWILGLVILIPILTETWGRFGMNTTLSFCLILPDDSGHSPEDTLFFCGFMLPFLTTSICYARIFYLVRKSSKKSQNPNRRSNVPDIDDSSIITSYPESEAAHKHIDVPPSHPRVQSMKTPRPITSKVTIVDEKSSTSNLSNIINIGKSLHLRRSQILDRAAPTSRDKRLLTMITAIMITFFVCYLPITALVLATDSKKSSTAHIYTYLFRYMTTCINPIIYVVMSKEYRKAYKKVLEMPSFSCCKGER